MIDEGLRLVAHAIDDESLIDQALALLRQWHVQIDEARAPVAFKVDAQEHLQWLIAALKDVRAGDSMLTSRVKLAAHVRVGSVRLKLGRITPVSEDGPIPSKT